MRPLTTTAAAALVLLTAGKAAAERYVVETNFHPLQPAQFTVRLNGQQLLLHRHANSSEGEADITRFVKPGKNTLEVDVVAGKNMGNAASVSFLRLRAGDVGHWRPLLKEEVGPGTPSGKRTLTFTAQPSKAAAPGTVFVKLSYNIYRPAEFDVLLGGKKLATLTRLNNHSLNLTPLLRPGKNVLTVRVRPLPAQRDKTNGSTVLTVGEQQGPLWNSLLKYGLGRDDDQPVTFTFPIYR